jgi:phage gp29-like protein
MAKKGRPATNRRIQAGGFAQISPERQRLDILLQAPELFHFDIAKYMSSLSSATAIDMYNRARLYDMYQSAFLTDPHLIGIKRKRLVGACRTPIEFVRNNKPDEEVNAVLKQSWFRRFRKDVVESELWGFSLLQFYRDSDGSINYDSIPRKHYDPVKQVVLRYQSDVDGEPVDSFSNTLVVGGDPRGVGLMSAIMPYVLYKRGNMGDWAQFCQIFGMPIREYTYDAGDEEARKRLIEDARRQGANAVYIHPKESALNIIESGNKTGSSDLYKDFTAECDSQMSIAMLGNTLTTDAKATGTQALGTIHQEEEDEIKEEDEALILAVLNGSQMLKILQTLGLNVEGGEFRFIEARNIDKTVQLNAVTQLHDKLGLPIDDDYLYDTFDIDKPENYDQLKAEALKKEEERQKQQDAMMQKLQKGGNEKKPKMPEIKNETAESFWNRLKGFFSEAPQDGAGFPF